jgi:hypothetical protein
LIDPFMLTSSRASAAIVQGLLSVLLAGGLSVHGTPFISEFMAANEGFLRDEDGESPPWIEVHNPDAIPRELNGWHLTDDQFNPSRWTFPTVSVPARGYLVVFASGKDRVEPEGELHTNFRLAREGEYLALIRPDGSVAHEFAPNFPPQRANISYGVQGDITTVLELDFNDRDANTADKTEPGFNAITLSTNPLTVDGRTIVIAAVGGATLDDRSRSVPLESQTLTQHRLYQDFIFAPGAVDGYGMRIRIFGLPADEEYRLTVWSVDPAGSTVGDRVSDWIEVASGTPTVLASGYAWNVNNPPSKDGDSTFTALVRTSPQGVLQIEGRRNGGVSSGVYLNALRLEGTAAPGHDPTALRYFSPATPGEPNRAGYAGIVTEPVFSVPRGFHDAPFTVAFSTPTEGAEIRWTLDGTAPTASTGTRYTAPVAITNTSFLRAAAFLPGHIASLPVTHSYLFLDEVLRQPANPPGYPMVWQADYPADYEMDPGVVQHPGYGATIEADLRSIPTLSIVAPHDAFWHSSTGIYVDATRRGPAWERSASVELFDGDGASAFQVNCGVRMQGNASRDNNRLAKHSFRLLFKSAHGPSKLRHDWFGGAVDRFDNIVLRACFTDSWATRYSPGDGGARYRPEDSIYLRDVWVKDSMADMGHLSGRGSFVHLYVNGLYWGVYNPCERLDASFFAQHLGGYESDWDVIRDFTELLDGSMTAWNEMMTRVNAGITTEADYQAVAERVDLENLIDYMLLHIFAEAEDWPHHNWYAARRRANPRGGLPATRWIFLPWDQEITLDRSVRRNRINVSHDNTPARIYSQLRAWPEFRRLFGDRIHRHLFNDGALTPEQNIARLQRRAGQIDRAIVGESARWGDARALTIGPNPGHGQTFTRDEWWVPELDQLATHFFPTLNGINLARFRAGGLYPTLDAPSLSVHGGTVPVGISLRMTHPNPSGAIYYTLNGEDPRVDGTGQIAASAALYSEGVPVLTPLTLKARVRANGQWSALTEAAFDTVVELQEIILPRYIQGQQPDNTDRVPFAFRLSVAGLKPNATYRYANRVVTADDPPTQDGAGNMIFVTSTGSFMRTTESPRFRPADLNLRHGEFGTDAAGRHTGWFITEPSGNARFTPGNTVFLRLLLNDGADGESYAHFLTAPSPVEVVAFGSAPGQATALHAQSAAADRNFVVLHDEPEGAQRPLTATVVEATGAAMDDRYAAFYLAHVAGQPGRWGTLIPNGLPDGVRRIEERDRATGDLVSLFVSPAGHRPTTNPASGTTPVGIRVPGPGDDGFTIWQSRHFNLVELADDTISGPMADPAQDGVWNLFKYAAGLSPFDAGSGAMPDAGRTEIDGTPHLVFQHRRLLDDTSPQYIVEISSDLRDWTDATSLLIPAAIEPVGDSFAETVTFLLPIQPAPAHHFLRLRVHMP